MIFIYCVFHILYFHIICRIHFVSLTLYFLYLYTGHILYICGFTLTIELTFTTNSRGNLIMFVIPYIFILYFSYTILSYDFHILCFSYIVLSFAFHILYLSYTFRVIDALFLVLVYLSYTFLFHILYLFIYFSCTMYFSYTVIFHILSSCTLLLVLVTIYYHRIAVSCCSYHVIYSINFICIYLSFSFRFHVCKYLSSGYGK